MATRKGTDHGDSADLGFGLGDLDLSAFADLSHADFGDFNVDGAGDSSFQHSDLDFSYADGGASGFGDELSEAESALIRLVEGKIAGARGRTAASKSEKVYVTHEDFDEGPERDAFLLIFGYAEHLFGGPKVNNFDPKSVLQMKALHFFFCRDLAQLNFEDAVNVIDPHIRCDVLRLRFMLEFWIRGWSLPPLPETADGLPSRVELMAAQHHGLLGISLAREVWFQPGIDASTLLLRVIDGRSTEIADQIKLAFNDMVCAYILSVQDKNVYLTGKNPILELQDKVNDPTVRTRGQLANINWSRRF